MTKIILIYTLIIGSGLTVKAQNNTEWIIPISEKLKKNPIIDPQEYDFSIIEAEYIFSKHCISCHGKTGKGEGKKAKLFTLPPTNLTSENVQKQKDGEIFWKISQGRDKMPSFKKILNEEDRWFLVNYIRNLAK